MIYNVPISGRALANVARTNELPANTIRRLIDAEIVRQSTPAMQPIETPQRVHLSERQAERVDVLRSAFRDNTGRWPEESA